MHSYLRKLISNLKHVIMLEEKNDNLPQVDGTENETSQEAINTIANNKSALEEIDNSNAEDSEDDSVQDRHNIPMLEYDTLSKEELTIELERLVANHKVMAIKDHVEEIRKAFTSKYNDLIDEKEMNSTKTIPMKTQRLNIIFH